MNKNGVLLEDEDLERISWLPGEPMDRLLLTVTNCSRLVTTVSYF